MCRGLLHNDTVWLLLVSHDNRWFVDRLSSVVIAVKGKEMKVQGSNMQFKSWLNQLSLSHESKTKKIDKQLSPEMVIKSVRSVWKGEGDYGGTVTGTHHWHFDRFTKFFRKTLNNYWTCYCK